MSMHALKVLAAAIVFATLGMVRCSMMPLSGGGTETGNPGMLECGRAVFTEVDNAEQWSVANYLPGGENQLDPYSLLTQQPVVPLAKSAAVAPDTLVIVRDSNFLIITIAGNDTVTVVDTVYNRITVVINRSVYDTVPPLSPAQGSSAIIVERIVPQTIQAIDTIIRSDTLIVPHRDTSYFPLTDSTTVFQIYERPNNEYGMIIGSSMNAARHLVVTADKMPLTPDPYSVYTRSSVSLSRSSLVRGTAVFEKYSNADEDGLLFTPDFTNFSQPQFDSYSQRVTPARVLFSGASTTGEFQNTMLSVLFDAGSDYRIATTADNRILSLSLQKVIHGRVTERISYAHQTPDSSCLKLDRYPLDGSISGSVWFCFQNGPDVLDHRQNKLSTIAKESYYTHGNLWKLTTRLAVNNPVSTPLSLLNGHVTAQLFYSGQGSGKFSGIVDRAAGKLYGVYTQNGVGQRVTYHRSSDMLEWDEELFADSGK